MSSKYFICDIRIDKEITWLPLNNTHIVIMFVYAILGWVMDFSYNFYFYFASVFKSVPAMFLTQLGLFILPLFLMLLGNIVNLLYPLDNILAIQLYFEVIQNMYILTLVEAPLQLRDRLSNYMFLLLYIGGFLTCRLILNTPCIRHFLTNIKLTKILLSNSRQNNKEKEVQKKEIEQDRFIRLKREHQIRRVKKHISDVQTLTIGSAFVFISFFTILVFALTLYIIYNIIGEAAFMAYYWVRFTNITIFCICALLFYSALFSMNQRWVTQKIKRAEISEISISEISVGYLKRVWGFYTLIVLLISLNFSYFE